ncbi:MAG: hypothetical protein ACXVW2_04840 [Nocardioidaceae bacterium]
MSSMRPRGPLPARVYWTRRLLMVAVVMGVVLGVARVVGGGGNPAGAASARPVGATETTSPPSSFGPTPAAGATSTPDEQAGPQQGRTGRGAATGTPSGQPSATPSALAQPTGPCADSDVQVTPSVDGTAIAGQDVTFTLNLTTINSPACTWQVSPRSVVLKLTSGSDRIWSTQDCPGKVPKEPVVIRQGRDTRVHVVWNGQRSDGSCSPTTPWAQPGYYHAEAAALGSTPLDVQFQLVLPTPQTFTAKPKQRHHHASTD